MKKYTPSGITFYYSVEVINSIMKKYGYDFFTALRKYYYSETYKMMANPKCAMWEFGTPAIFEIWECELRTGDPRNSVYIKED